MDRVVLDNDCWFDKDTAESFKGKVGKETLYRTAKGEWVLYEFNDEPFASVLPGHKEYAWRVIEKNRVVGWLVRNGYDAAAEKWESDTLAGLER